MVPEGRLHMRPFQFHLKQHWRFPQSLDTLLPWTETISAHLEWWQNPTNVMNGADLHPKDYSIKLLADTSKPNSVGCYGQLNSSSLHKQTRNSLCRDVCSPVEDHDLVPSLPENLNSQTHSRVSECDGRPSVQIEPSPVNRMVTASADLSQVVHSSCRSLRHLSEPQSSTVHISSPRPKCLGHRCSEQNRSGLTAYLALPRLSFTG